MSSTANRVIKNTGYLYAKMGITMFISLYTTRLILNSLGASDFGIFNIVGGAIAMLGFLNAAMASATQRFMSYSEGEGNKDKQKSIFNISFMLHFLLAWMVGIVLLIAGYFFFNGILNIPSDRIFAAKVVYGSLIVSTMFTVMTVPYDAVMNAHENMKYYAIVGVIESFLKLSVALVCVYTSFDKLIVYGALMACIPLLTLSIMRVYCHKHYEECKIAVRRYWDKPLMKEMASFAGWNFTNTASSMISTYGQGILLNIFFGTLVNAALGITNQINGQIQVLSQNMLKAINPLLGKSYGANKEELLKFSVLLGAKYSTALYSLIAIPLLVQTPFILQVWLKEIPEWSIIFIRIQIIKSLFEFQFITILSSIQATGRIRKFVLWSSTLYTLQLPIQYIIFSYGFPPYSMYIISMLFSNLLVYFIALKYANRYINLTIDQYIKEVTIPLAQTIILNIVIQYTISSIYIISNIMELILYFIFTIIVFILIFFKLSTKKQEKIEIINLLKKLRNTIFNKKI